MLFLPAGYELARALSAGRLPLWTPNLQAGFPLFAEGHIAALYPPNLILYCLLPTQLALSYLLLLHLAWSSVGTFLLARLAGFRIPGALLAGFVLGMCGFTLAHIQHLTLLATAAWLPWLLALQILYQRAIYARDHRGIFWFLGASLVVGLEFLSGFPQVAIINLSVFLAAGMVGPWLWNRPNGTLTIAWIVSSAFRSLGIATLCIALGVGISAVQWVPTAELLNLSVRSDELGAEFFTSFSMKPAALTQFLFPFEELGMPTVLNMEYWAYLGVLPFLLGLMALFFRRDGRTWFFVLIALVFLLLSLGENNPLYLLLYHVPVFNRFRVPARFLFPFSLALALLAAASFDALRARLPQSSRTSRAAIALAGISILVLVGLIAAPSPQPLDYWGSVWTLLPWLFLSSAGLVFILALFRRLEQNQFAAGVLILTILDLALYAQPFRLTLNNLVGPAERVQAPLSIKIMDSHNPYYRLFTNVYNETLRPNHTLLYGKPSAQLSSPLGLRKNEEYISNVTPAMFNLLGVRYLSQPVGSLAEDFSPPPPPISLNLFAGTINLPPTRVAKIQITSFTHKTGDLPNGFVAGEITLSSQNNDPITLPLRLGIETADWAYEGLASQFAIKHSKPSTALSFPGYLLSLRREFMGFKYVAEFTLPTSRDITAISAVSNLDDARLVIESVVFIDEQRNPISLARLAHRSDLSVAFHSHAVMVLENRDTLPRAFMVHSAQVMEDARVLAKMREPGFRPERTALLSEGQPLPDGDPTGANADDVFIEDYKPERVVVKAQTAHAGYLILADSWYPGWEAFVDGEKTPIYRADYMFRAVPIQPGIHTIVFAYHPVSFALGAAISLVTLVLIGGLAIISFKGFRGAGSNASLDQ